MSVTTQPVPVEVTLRGNVGSFAGEYAHDKISGALGVGHVPVRNARVVLDWRRDPAVERPAVAEASADVDGRPVRAKTAAATMPEAVDELVERLRRQLVSLHDRTRTLQRQPTPPPPLPFAPRPEDEREVVRHKSFASAPMTVEEAAYEMELLDHAFFLYREVATDAPALVYRLPDGQYAAACPPPPLTDAQARTRLETFDEPFVFYLDRDSGEGKVLYHRYDGHYGLIDLAD